MKYYFYASEFENESINRRSNPVRSWLGSCDKSYVILKIYIIQYWSFIEKHKKNWLRTQLNIPYVFIDIKKYMYFLDVLLSKRSIFQQINHFKPEMKMYYLRNYFRYYWVSYRRGNNTKRSLTNNFS